LLQLSTIFHSSFSYLIPILLLISSFVIYSYNLEGQPYQGDEALYLAWGGIYFDLVKEGDFSNPCLKGLANCELLYDPNWEGHNINYTIIRNFFVGFGQFLTTGEIEGQFYEWSCAWFPCWDFANQPSQEELASGRFFSPIFGSLTIVLAFFIGKILFNRTIGIFASIILLFHSLWLTHSRLILTEVYLYFFIFLSIFLLLKSFKRENNHRTAFFILGAISFGLALNTKLIGIEFVIPIVILILFYDSFNEKLNFRFFKNRKNVLKVISLVIVFFVISSISFVAIFPKYYDDAFNNILKIKDESEIGFASFPTAEKNYLFQTLITLQVTLFPYLMDSYIHDVFPEQISKIRLQYPSVEPTGAPSNYSTIPLTLFFFIGLIYMIRKIKTGSLLFSEFTLLVWLVSLFIFSVLVVDDPTIERYYFPLMFSIIFIASYGLWKFIKQIQNQKVKILFSLLFIITHSLYIISFFDDIYFSSAAWINPLPVSSQLSFSEPLVYLSSLAFVMIFAFIYLVEKIGAASEPRQVK